MGGALTDWVGYREAMGIAASLTTLGALVAWLFLPETRHLKGDTEMGGETAVPSPDSPHQTAELSVAIGLLGVNRLVMAGILMSTFGLYLRDLLGETAMLGGWSVGVATLTGAGLGATALLNMLSTPLIGRLSDRAGNRWRFVSGSVAAGIAGFGLLAVGLPIAIWFGLPLTSASSGSNQGLSTTLVGDLSGKGQRGRFLGVLFTVGDLGSAIGPPLAYGLLPLWGTQGIYWLCAALLGMMLLAAVWRGGKRPFYAPQPR